MKRKRRKTRNNNSSRTTANPEAAAAALKNTTGVRIKRNICTVPRKTRHLIESRRKQEITEKAAKRHDRKK